MVGEPAVAGRKSHSKTRGCEFQKVEGLERLETLAGEFRKPSSLSSLSRLFEKKSRRCGVQNVRFREIGWGLESLESLDFFEKARETRIFRRPTC